MGMNDVNSLSHSKWNCKYHIVFGRCQVVVGFFNSKMVAHLPVGIKGKMNGVPPLTPTDICAVRKVRLLSPDFIYSSCSTAGTEG